MAGKSLGLSGNGLLLDLGVSFGETDLELGFQSTSLLFCLMEVAILVVIVYLLTLLIEILKINNHILYSIYENSVLKLPRYFKGRFHLLNIYFINNFGPIVQGIRLPTYLHQAHAHVYK